MMMPDASPVLPMPPSQEEVKARNAQRQELLRRLDSKHPDLSAQAIEECSNLPASEIRVLLHMAEDPGHTQSLLRRLVIGFVFLSGIGLCLALIFSKSGLGFFCYCAIAWLLPVILYYREGEQPYSARLQNNLAIVVSNTQDSALLPEAMHVLNSMRLIYSQNLPPLRQALFDKSVDFLQKLDIAQIRSYGIQQQALCLFLEPGIRHNTSRAAIRVLNYLEQYGTSSALLQVSSIANAKAFREEDKEVREAALTCLAALQQRAHESSQPQMLLRAAVAPTTDPDALLRPATAQASHQESDTLLRPANTMQSKPPISGKIINGNSET